ncbi:MAG TPA: hypothetical protein VHV83_07595 [Armatimonadota bacterium]|nr:hypothetical protein [Armatimonadota bacterium]
MRRLSPSIFSRGLLFGLFLLLATSVLAQNPANLVQNNGFEIATNGAPAQWQYCANGATEHDVTHDLARNAAEGSSCLRLASHSTKHAHVWMKQVVAVEAGVPYQFTCQAKGFPNTDNIDYEVSTGFEFFDAAGNWLGYKGGANVAYRKGLYPSATVAPVTAWKKFSTQVIPPLGCAKLGIRLTLESDGAAEAYFDDLALTRPAQTVQQMLELTAPTIPVYVIAQHPVTAMGVTLTPDWRLDDAETMRSSERMRICLNGLWAFQPAASVTMPASIKKAYLVSGFAARA